MKIPSWVRDWKFWAKAAITVILVTLVWPKIQEGLAQVSTSPFVIWGTILTDLAMMIVWRDKRRWVVLLLWIFQGAIAAWLSIPVQGLVLAVALLLLRVILIALLMSLREEPFQG